MTLRLIIVALLVACFGLAAFLEPRLTAKKRTGPAGSFLESVLGDARKLFANDVFARADAYFHRGNYPSIFEVDARKEEDHMLAEASGHDAVVSEESGGHEHRSHSCAEGCDHDHHEEEAAHGNHDWIAKFGRHFRPSVHVHIEKGAEREMLPWLKFSAELDPNRVETYTVAAYWLRKRLDKVDEAEQFLRQGLWANPRNPEILNELGWLLLEDRNDPARARNVWLAAHRQWREVEAAKEKPNLFLLGRILAGLVTVERSQGRINEAIEYLKQLQTVSHSPEHLQKQIDELSSALNAPASE
jgi:tetratricopeptide (TPR) repeat protein